MINFNKEDINILAKKTALHPILAELLVKRGIDTIDKANKFLSPSINELTCPYGLAGMADAVKIIKTHISQNSSIVIYGDYDCDGIGASAILYLALTKLGGKVETFIPVRSDEGYGLSFEGLDKVISAYNPHLIITVDCGINSVDEIAYAKEKGVEIIVTDHHEPQEKIPECVILNPKMQEDYPMVCGAGVALKLVEAIKDRDFAMEYVDICAISTIADMVPLVGDNRIIASLGLKKLAKNTRTGLSALLKTAGHKPNDRITSYDIAYKIAPRLNASGRLSSAEKSLRLLIENDPYIVHMLATELELENKERQDICQKTILEAQELLKSYDLFTNKVIILYKDDWEGGVVGIAAAKISQEFQRPTILFSSKDGGLRGSCRSIDGINIYDVLDNCKQLLEQFGGHSMAAGLTIKKENLPAFMRMANEYVIKTYDKGLFLPHIKHDACMDLSDIDDSFASALRRFEPFGMDNLRPVFMQEITATKFEQISIHNHIKYSVNSNVDVVGFNYLDYLNILKGNGKKKLYYNVEKEVFRNRESIKCYIRDIAVDEIVPSSEDLVLSYLDKFVKRTTKSLTVSEKFAINADYGHLLIAFSQDTYEKLIKKYPNYRRQYGILDTQNPYNTILLAPYSATNNFDYFGVIEVYDNAPNQYINYLKNSYNAQIIVHDNDITMTFPSIDVKEMRETYLFIKKHFNKKSQKGIYNLMVKKGYKYKHQLFLIIFYIFKELEIINIKDDIIHINQTKVDINQSKIYSLLESNERSLG